MNALNNSFMGYVRENGRVGVRNHVAILPVDDISYAVFCLKKKKKLIQKS